MSSLNGTPYWAGARPLQKSLRLAVTAQALDIFSGLQRFFNTCLNRLSIANGDAAADALPRCTEVFYLFIDSRAKVSGLSASPLLLSY